MGWFSSFVRSFGRSFESFDRNGGARFGGARGRAGPHRFDQMIRNLAFDRNGGAPRSDGRGAPPFRSNARFRINCASLLHAVWGEANNIAMILCWVLPFAAPPLYRKWKLAASPQGQFEGWSPNAQGGGEWSPNAQGPARIPGPRWREDNRREVN